jgi:hypothetical protein
MSSAQAFVSRWANSDFNEQQGAQNHFIELCELLGFSTPSQYNNREVYTFEKPVIKAGGESGRADVWFAGRFAWEYKGKRKNLKAAYYQLLEYKDALNNPPVLVVCDFLTYELYLQYPNIPTAHITFTNDDLLQPEFRRYLQWTLEDPTKFLRYFEDQQQAREKITEDLAEQFAAIADVMRTHGDGWSSMRIARFLTRLIFALFVEDVGLLPRIGENGGAGIGAMSYIIRHTAEAPEGFKPVLTYLFKAMAGEQSDFMMKPVPFFNGGLFRAADGSDDGTDVLDITMMGEHAPIDILEKVSAADWSAVNPAIFGTLFERALDAGKRAQLGAHYTKESDILLVVDPVLMQPLNRYWEETIAKAAPLLAQLAEGTALTPKQAQEARDQLKHLHDEMMARLENTRVLDPACGSGNFLYVSLRALKDLEGRIRALFAPLGLPFRDVVTPRQLSGIEKDEFAAKLAHVVVWIGYLQWRYEHEGEILHPYNPRLWDHDQHPQVLPNPIIQDRLNEGDLDRILCADAILRYDADGKPYEPEWVEADVIMGNPPFLGGKRMRSELGGYVDDLFTLYANRVPAEADLVCYWYEKARAHIERTQAKRAGLLATNSIRGGANRAVLDRVKQTGDIFMAWSDREWTLEGAAVRISIIGFDDGAQKTYTLNGAPVDHVNSDLQNTIDATKAQSLPENYGLAFMGITPAGPFDITDQRAQVMLAAQNASGVSNADVVRPYRNADDIVQRSRKAWTIDFGTEMSEEDAARYELPYAYVNLVVRPERLASKQPQREKDKWWIYTRSRPEMRDATKSLSRYIATPLVSKHRIFVWLDPHIIPSNSLDAIAREDDYFFGILHSYAHEIWSLRLGTWLGKGNDPRYTPTTTFETFPFPYPPGTENFDDPRVQAISAAAKMLHEEREAWLNPAELISMGMGEKGLRERTLTNLYNAMADYRAGKGNGKQEAAAVFAPRLAALHDALDAAVLEAYGWGDLMPLTTSLSSEESPHPLTPSPLHGEEEGESDFVMRTAAGDEELLRRLLALNLARAGT